MRENFDFESHPMNTNKMMKKRRKMYFQMQNQKFMGNRNLKTFHLVE